MTKTLTLLIPLLLLSNILFAAGEKVHFIENDLLKVGILNNAGGRLVFLSARGSENMILSDFDETTQSFPDVITPNDTSGFTPYNGFITWVGPQSQWWQQQEINQKRKTEHASWPPDPYTIYGEYTIDVHTDNVIKLVGNTSPVTGLQIIKTFKLNGNKILIRVEAINKRDLNVSWDIWSNIRMDGATEYFVPEIDPNEIRITPRIDDQHEEMSYKLDKGIFTTIPEQPHQKPMRHLKAFLAPKKGIIVAVSKGNIMEISFPKVPTKKIHPEQGFVEIYHLIGNDESQNLLELEHHGAYQEIRPGKSITLQETWTITPLIRNTQIDDIKLEYK